MLAIAIIIGVVYMALNYAGQSPPLDDNTCFYNREKRSYQDNEYSDFQVR